MRNWKTLETTVRSMLSNKLNEWTISDVELAMKKKHGKVDGEAIKKLKSLQHMGNVDRNALIKVGHGKLQVEEKDETEYGYEGDMAISQLKTIVRNSEILLNMLKPETDLPEWVQSKITLATDYIQTAEAYLTSEMNEETVKEEHLEEGRPSQRHPLEGHVYHKKTDAELVYIAKDARAAAQSMKSHNTTAEKKYLDQVSDSATVRHFRKTSGTPDWYKKKYGHMKEEVENKIYETAAAGLAAKAEKSGVSIGTLRTVYKRGVAAWNSGHRPGTTPQQWGMARVNSYITKGKGTYHGADKDLREEELVNEAVPKDKESGLPKKYVAGLSTSTAKARATHWDKMDKKSDSDPSAYEPAPGDATAKTKPSKHTLKYNKMFGETVSEAPKTPLQRLRDFDTKRMALSKLFKDGKKPIFDKPGAVDKKTNDNK